MQTIYTDVLVIGAGLAGERAAAEAAQAGFSAICLSIVPARRSQSAMARSGMQAALVRKDEKITGNPTDDSPEAHFADTVRASDWGCDQEAARRLATRAPVEARRLAAWGLPWSRTEGDGAGRIAGSPCAGASAPRLRRAFDATGRSMLATMDNVCAKLGVEVHDRTEAIALIHDGYTCYGVVARCLRAGELNVYLARATVIAAGGFGRLYAHSTGALVCDGGAHALVLDTGLVPLANMEAVEFHPTALPPSDILLPDECLSAGGAILDAKGERCVADVRTLSNAELARDMTRRLRAGCGVRGPFGEHLWLDVRHLGAERVTSGLDAAAALCAQFLGLDPTQELIPVRPAQRFCLGGVRTDKDGCAYGLKGLFACGEAACWDPHGFGRLEGNALAETVVAGGMVGEKIAEFLQGVEGTFHSSVIDAAVKRQEERIRNLILCKAGTESVFRVRTALREALEKGAGPLRDKAGLTQCVAALQEVLARARRVGLKSNGKGVNPELAAALRIEGQVKLGLMTACGALAREETRGCHFREDFPERDDAGWLVRTLALWRRPTDDSPVLGYEQASRVMELPPEKRGPGASAGNGEG